MKWRSLREMYNIVHETSALRNQGLIGRSLLLRLVEDVDVPAWGVMMRNVEAIRA